MTTPAQPAAPQVPAAAVRALAAAISTLGHQLGFHGRGGGTVGQLTHLGADPADAQALAEWLQAGQ